MRPVASLFSKMFSSRLLWKTRLHMHLSTHHPSVLSTSRVLVNSQMTSQNSQDTFRYVPSPLQFRASNTGIILVISNANDAILVLVSACSRAVRLQTSTSHAGSSWAFAHSGFRHLWLRQCRLEIHYQNTIQAAAWLVKELLVNILYKNIYMLCNAIRNALLSTAIAFIAFSCTLTAAF